MVATANKDHPGNGPKYFLNIEGLDDPAEWDEATITGTQIAELGGWDISQGVVEIDADNNERTLQAHDVVELKPGVGFSKKFKWKRG